MKTTRYQLRIRRSGREQGLCDPWEDGFVTLKAAKLALKDYPDSIQARAWIERVTTTIKRVKLEVRS